MKVVIGTFARVGIEAHLGCDVTLGVHEALHHYVRRGEAERLSSHPPFLRHLAACDGEDLELFVDQEIREALEEEARESGGLSAEQLAGHAVLLYLAELDRDDDGAVGTSSGPLTLV